MADVTMMDWQATPPAAEINATYNPAMLERRRPRDEFEIPNMPGGWVDYYTERQFNVKDVVHFQHLTGPSITTCAIQAVGRAKRRCIEAAASVLRAPSYLFTSAQNNFTSTVQATHDLAHQATYQIARRVRRTQAVRRRRPVPARQSPRQSPQQVAQPSVQRSPDQLPQQAVGRALQHVSQQSTPQAPIAVSGPRDMSTSLPAPISWLSSTHEWDYLHRFEPPKPVNPPHTFNSPLPVAAHQPMPELEEVLSSLGTASTPSQEPELPPVPQPNVIPYPSHMEGNDSDLSSNVPYTLQDLDESVSSSSEAPSTPTGPNLPTTPLRNIKLYPSHMEGKDSDFSSTVPDTLRNMVEPSSFPPGSPKYTDVSLYQQTKPQDFRQSSSLLRNALERGSPIPVHVRGTDVQTALDETEFSSFVPFSPDFTDVSSQAPTAQDETEFSSFVPFSLESTDDAPASPSDAPQDNSEDNQLAESYHDGFSSFIPVFTESLEGVVHGPTYFPDAFRGVNAVDAHRIAAEISSDLRVNAHRTTEEISSNTPIHTHLATQDTSKFPIDSDDVENISSGLPPGPYGAVENVSLDPSLDARLAAAKISSNLVVESDDAVADSPSEHPVVSEDDVHDFSSYVVVDFPSEKIPPQWYEEAAPSPFSKYRGVVSRRMTRQAVKDEAEAQKRKEEERQRNLEKAKISSLSEEWEDKVRKAVRAGFAPDYTAADFARVVPPQQGRFTDSWLNDESVNGYLKLATKFHNTKHPSAIPKSHAFPSFMLKQVAEKGYRGVERWARRAKIGGADLLQTHTIFIPVNNGSHWTLMVVYPGARTAHYYDSMDRTRSNNGRQWFDLLKIWLRGELGTHYNEREWSFFDKQSPQQNNSSDCGVFAITTAKMLILGADVLGYGPNDIPLQRKRIVAELVNGDFL
ncbi:hypothetical protein EPUS_01967 [Endocarpon pusillum Z07020]|uniref:Ubiquitin-like protease family profile domain-containing protein n=1 Tax=Endocarpon pusillum (strain Z07020 / HMAS-L-300199) TaxID=1263415 RepID=U1HUH0_ENDPU|nr:uncharacterized protein EPUS_01967 [Endocarpon pusillum Z07020]ERF74280.1 hypothetical protein EPUS_01967 [Endocarpon pusillum Z07020]